MAADSGRVGVMPKAVLRWLPLAIVLSVLCGLIYIGVQQVWRMSANDPQVQMAQDIAARLASGAQPQSLVSGGSVDLNDSLAPFVIIYDAGGKTITSTATLDGELPVLPDGVLESARSSGEGRITWQPKPGVRLATIIDAVNSGRNGYALVGRSLLETENRIEDWSKLVLIAWGIGLAGSLFATWLDVFLIDKLSKSS